MTQTGIHNRMNRSEASAGQHGHRPFDRQGHINDHPVAFHHTQRFQAVGEAADHAVKLSIGDDALAAIFAQPNEGGTIATVRVGVPVQGIDGDVGLGAREPFVMDAIPLQHAVPLARPGKTGRVVCPEAFGIFERACAFSQPVLLNGVADYSFWRCIFLIQRQQVGDVFLFRRG